MKNQHFSFFRIVILLSVFTFSISYSIAQSETEEINEAIVTKTKAEKKAERKRLNKEALKGRRFNVNVTLNYAKFNSEMRVTGPNGVLGATISFEDLLGFDENKFIPSFDAEYSFTRHSGIYAEYYAIFRDATFDITEEFEYGDVIIPEGGGILRTFFNTQIWSMGYMYSFINSEKANLSVFVNFFILGFKTGIDIDSQNISERLNFTAPLPSFGYKFSYEIAPKLRFAASHSFFFLEIGGFSGSINNLRLSLDYEATSWMRAGLGYTAFNLDLSIIDDNFTGDFFINYKGPAIYTQFVF